MKKRYDMYICTFIWKIETVFNWYNTTEFQLIAGVTDIILQSDHSRSDEHAEIENLYLLIIQFNVQYMNDNR